MFLHDLSFHAFRPPPHIPPADLSDALRWKGWCTRRMDLQDLRTRPGPGQGPAAASLPFGATLGGSEPDRKAHHFREVWPLPPTPHAPLPSSPLRSPTANTPALYFYIPFRQPEAQSTSQHLL